ncbi:CDP-alcohol phosphatidyltransferase family protein [Shinella kummerowiae]|jgi:CDP-diacylglycerol--glycerol-3-phosphate 3-phosphatidyltransferase|uniref:CDP-alcohol phosphatidyltransferase family protein n=1 Tax=Shinella kummerowiae TaxID=417745 RepID=A0A6N8SCB3_9HYPH|nr:CDP-alcohol phosphatidyltransferase family protein [Shinella kummerowiae]MXN46725.1 CDP-alcohol phosphatidyltransferase family protein [Shinella kummerowiae]
MSIYKLKSSFQTLLRPLVGRLAGMGVTANQVTLIAATVSVAIGALLVLNPEPALFALVPIWMALRMAFNAVDGMLAREHGQKSALGGYLNEITDVVSDAALYVPFALIAPFSLPWLFAIIFLATLTEFAGVLGVAHGKGRNYEGPMGKSDRALLFGALGALVAVFGVLPAWTWHIQPMTCVLLVWTVVNRIRAGLVEA